VVVGERNFAELAGEFTCDNFRKRHEAGLRVGRHGEAALERAHAVCSADPGAEHEGVAAVEGDGWLEVDGSRRVRHVISGESPYLARQLSVF
jgi:methionine synthase II (cobalamin-independent)